MISIFIGYLSVFSGQNVISLGLALRFVKDGYKTGYFKPIGDRPVPVGDVISDEDCVFFHSALKLADPVTSLCPVVLTERKMESILMGQLTGVRDQIMQGYKAASKGKDLLIAMGIGDLRGGTFLGMSHLEFIKETKSRTILADRPQYTSTTVDACMHAKEELGNLLAGVVFNRLKPRRKEYVERTVVPYLENRGVPVLGLIPEDSVLGAVSVRDMAEALAAKILCCEDKLDELVERLMVGAMNMDTALRHFRRTPNKAVITGGDRSDIQLAALETSTRCLILTGDLYPNDVILGRAQEKAVPVLVVRSDTLQTVEQCESLMGRLSLTSHQKLQRITEIADTDISFSRLYKSLGLTK
jgi:BioD-like phosphotransacetylase family protein